MSKFSISIKTHEKVIGYLKTHFIESGDLVHRIT